jgi:hypothetical protein
VSVVKRERRETVGGKQSEDEDSIFVVWLVQPKWLLVKPEKSSNVKRNVNAMSRKD